MYFKNEGQKAIFKFLSRGRSLSQMPESDINDIFTTIEIFEEAIEHQKVNHINKLKTALLESKVGEINNTHCDKHGCNITLLDKKGSINLSAFYSRLSHLGKTPKKSDKDLLRQLIKAGDEHAKSIRDIEYSVLITAPRYMFAEIDSYCVGSFSTGSSSTMHDEAKGLTGESIVIVKDLIPEGILQTRGRSISLQACKRIVDQRKNHRLPQWKTICNFIENLDEYKALYMDSE